MRPHYRYGLSIPRTRLWDAAGNGRALLAGEIVYSNGGSDYVNDTLGFTWDTDIHTTRANFAPCFAGLVIKGSQGDGSAEPVVIETSPIAAYSFPCVESSFEHGELFALAEGSSSLVPTQLERIAITGLDRAIAVCVDGSGGALATQCTVFFRSPGLLLPNLYQLGAAPAAVGQLTDNSGGTASGIAAIAAGAAYTQADMTAVKNAIATLAAQLNLVTNATRAVGVTGR